MKTTASEVLNCHCPDLFSWSVPILAYYSNDKTKELKLLHADRIVSDLHGQSFYVAYRLLYNFFLVLLDLLIMIYSLGVLFHSLTAAVIKRN